MANEEERQVPFEVRVELASTAAAGSRQAGPTAAEDPETAMAGLSSVSLHSDNGLYVEAAFRDDGALEISGQDLSGAMGWEEYEYVITVLPDNLPTLAAALGGQPGADVMQILYAKRTELMARGEEAWLRDHGIPTEFWSRIESGG